MLAYHGSIAGRDAALITSNHTHSNSYHTVQIILHCVLQYSANR